jgi:predicted acylesterase/phospholipase RssA
MSPGLGLTLSGGGFRATLFHLGVVAAFRQLGRLREISVVSCVSGGSIIGAHLVLHWRRYSSNDNDVFHAVARELVAITTADVRGQILRRLPLRRHLRFEYCLNRYLYSDSLLTAVEGHDRPVLVLNATDLRHGTAAAFVGGSYLPDVREPELEDGTPTSIDVGPFSLARAVACSAAFPALFPARDLSAKDFAQPRRKWEAGASLTDGGVYDNLGIQFFLGSRGKAPQTYYVSDAGAPFDYVAGLGRTVLSRATRVTDVQMNLLRTAIIEDVADAAVPVRQISIGDEPLTRQDIGRQDLIAGIPPREIVRRLQLIRTDLDEFTELEIDLLIRHGFTVAYRELNGDLGCTTTVTSAWSISERRPAVDSIAIQEYASQLEKSQQRRFGLFNPKDRTFPVPWFLIAFTMFVVVGALYVARPFVNELIRSPLIDRALTGRPYRLTQVVRHVVLQPAPVRAGRQGVLATSRLLYWTRLNQDISHEDATFTESFFPTYERSTSVHGLGVIGANAIRESEGTLPFAARQELTFDGPSGHTLLLGTGIEYEFDWPGPLRSLEGVVFGPGEDYWAYENTSDYIDHLAIVVESRSDRLLVRSNLACAILYRANRRIEQTPCATGENDGAVRSGLRMYGGALVARFNDLEPGDQAIIKYRLIWR